MIELKVSTESDIPQIVAWIAQDPWHKGQPPEFWLTAAKGTVLAFKLVDDGSPILYCRIDAPQDC